MAKTAPDTSYRDMPLTDLQALRTSILVQLKAIEGVGQNHSVSGRNTSLADFEKLSDRLVSVNSAIAWKANAANRGNNGYASRYISFNPAG